MPSNAHRADDRLARLARLTFKELREILRDRRTMLTLFVMPLLLYPLLSVAFQQFFLSQLGAVQVPHYVLGFRSAREEAYVTLLLAGSGVDLNGRERGAPLVSAADPTPVVEAGVWSDLELALERFDINVGIRLTEDQPVHFDPRYDLAVELELLYRDDSIPGRAAAAWVEKLVIAANRRFLDARLKRLDISQRAEPVRISRRPVASAAGEGAGAVSITAVVPFVLILMTITGAVYPAIDLTAGERERGTLEVLVAAPIPRIGVLVAKYLAVLTVALLTAAANLATMTITITLGGLAPLLFGAAGISAGTVAAVFGLLLLFAAFFSAVLLVITSTARSFKEAQAYLIPVMIVALAPGMVGLVPGLELSGLLLVTPLANIVLLGRDLFAMQATAGAAAVVVASTLVYAGAAIALAARIFGAESVLYDNQSGWFDLFRRPRERRQAPSFGAAVLCLALMIPAYFALINLVARGPQAPAPQLALGMLVTVCVFGGLPAAACAQQRVDPRYWMRLPLRAAPVLAMAGLLGASLWTIDHELVLYSRALRGVVMDAAFLEKVRGYAASLRELAPGYLVMALAVVPAVFEEFFFRGYLFAAFPGVGGRSSAVASEEPGPQGAGVLAAIVGTSLVFGLFHVIVPNPLAPERFVSSTFMGVVLGWVRWRTQSVLPGIFLHALHNGVLALFVSFEPQLAGFGIGVVGQSHLPALWLAAGATAACGASVGLYLFTKTKVETAAPSDG